MEALAREEPIAPDEAAFRAHLAGAYFQDGVERGRWRLVEINWPHALIAVSAAPRDNGPMEFVLRFQLDGYPAMPTATPWDPETDQQLAGDRRPKGVRVGQAFRPDWQNGSALYVPCDRVSCSGHSDWPTRYPSHCWDPTVGIACYLRLVHDLLNDDDYEGV